MVVRGRPRGCCPLPKSQGLLTLITPNLFIYKIFAKKERFSPLTIFDYMALTLHVKEKILIFTCKTAGRWVGALSRYFRQSADDDNFPIPREFMVN